MTITIPVLVLTLLSVVGWIVLIGFAVIGVFTFVMLYGARYWN